MHRLYSYSARGLRFLLDVAVGAILLFLTAGALLYCPPVQRWAVDEACQWAECRTGYSVTLSEVRLAFPLNLVLGNLCARDAEGDTLLRCRALSLHVPVRPLLEGRVDVDEFLLCQARVDTKSLIADTHVAGSLAYAAASLHGYSWDKNHLQRLRADVRGADMIVVLTDTAQPDTTPSAPWLVELSEARLRNSRLRLRLPDTPVEAPYFADLRIDEAHARGGYFDTKAERYDLHHLTLRTSPSSLVATSIPAFAAELDTLGYTAGTLRAAASLAVPDIAQGKFSVGLHDALSDSRYGTAHLAITTQQGLNTLLHQYAGEGYRIPAGSQLTADVRFRTLQRFWADLSLRSHGGSAKAKGQVNLSSEQYSLSASLQSLRPSSFAPALADLTPITGNLRVEGTGYSHLPEQGVAVLQARIRQGRYAQYPLSDTRLSATLRQGALRLGFDMHNAMLQADGTLTGNLHHMLSQAERGYAAQIQMCVDAFNPYAVGLMQDSLTIGARFAASVNLSRDLRTLYTGGCLDELCIVTPDTMVRTRDIDYDLTLRPDTTTLQLTSGDMLLALHSSVGFQQLADASSRFVDTMLEELERGAIDQSRLAALLPRASLRVSAGRHNPLSALCQMAGYRVSSLDLQLDASPATGLSGWTRLGPIGLGALDLDTIYADILQDADGVKLMGQVRNYRKENPYHFSTTVDAYALATGAGADLVFKDEKGNVGVDIGVQANYETEGLRVHFYPRTPIIAYRRFTVNDDNYLFLGRDSTLRANIDLLADDGTGLKLYGEPTEDGDNDLTLSINRLNLAELSSVMPWMPQLGGYISGDCHVTKASDVYSAMLSMQTDMFAYEGIELGTLGTEIMYLPKEDGEHYAEAYLSYGDSEVLQARGSYFSRGQGSFVGDVHLESLPLQLLDAFTAALKINFQGEANGDFHAEGPLSEPVMNGSITFDDAHIRSSAYGLNFRMDNRPVRIANSRLTFDDFALRTAGKSPFLISGYADARNLSDVKIDLRLNTRGFELINAPRSSDSELFGKVYTDFTGTVRGNLESLKVRGNLAVLDGTNATYILRDTPVSVEDEFEGLVTFVDFNDSTQVVKPVAEGMNIDVIMGISISEAAHFRCLLAEDGHSYVDIRGGGDLSFAYTQQGDMSLTGRYTIESGEMKYELPVIPLKTFAIAQGSYVEFAGRVDNPLLNIRATEKMKAAVAENGQNRTAQFEVGVEITHALEDMQLNFLIEAPEDAGVQNELSSMTDLQRSRTAVALIATGMYVTDDVSSLSTGFSGSNALNMFLQNSIQRIAGNALGTVDINFDIDNSTSAAGTTTNYNFAFAKRFWGDRISVIIGGRVSDGAGAENTAASIINNISVEYRLDKGASRYVRLFYDRSSRDPLEGTLMKTGAGLVLRRKTNRLGELFLFRR